MRNNLFAKFIITLMLAALLLSGSKASGTFALAEYAPEIAPVFDTQIYQLQDYFQQNIEGTSHEPVFYIMLGIYTVLQAGMGQFQLDDPYTTQDGVKGWLKSTGIQMWNSLNAFISFDPVTGTDLRPTLMPFVALALGAAQKSLEYNSELEFFNEVLNSENYMLPFNKGFQMGINSILQQNGGLYDWQDDIPYEFVNNFHWYNQGIPDIYQNDYYSAVNNLTMPRHFGTRFPESTNRSAYVVSTLNCIDKFDLFINTTDHTVSFHESSTFNVNYVYFYSYNYTIQNGNANIVIGSIPYDPSLYSNYVDVIQYAFDQDWTQSSYKLLSFANHGTIILNSMEFVDKIYIGSSWDNKQLFTPNMTLNFVDNDLSYYLQVQNDYLVDIKGLINDLLNVTNLYQTVIDNLYDPNGSIVVDPSLIQVNVNLPDTNPLPVNLNDIAEFTDNEYLDVVKERVNAFSDTVGSFVAFWHNIDYEIIYAVGGAAIVILLGAFIGKWGHS